MSPRTAWNICPASKRISPFWDPLRNANTPVRRFATRARIRDSAFFFSRVPDKILSFVSEMPVKVMDEGVGNFSSEGIDSAAFLSKTGLVGICGDFRL